MFKASWSATLKLLRSEIEAIKGKPPIVFQIDVAEGDIRLDGLLRANAKVGHPGVVVTFQSKYGPLRYATDVYEQPFASGLQSWQANIRAIALALQSLRAVDRYGVTRRGEQYTGWKAITGSGSSVFGTADDAISWMQMVYKADTGNASDHSPRDLYRLLAKRYHPDVNINTEIWDRLQEAAQLIGLGKEITPAL